MKQFYILFGALILTSVLLGQIPVLADEADAFFDDSYVHEIRITFADSGWYSTLYNSHNSDPDDPYFSAQFEYDGTVLDPVGVRFKGNSSFGISGVKKSFKIDFNEFDETLTFMGMKKLNLNNGFKDPTMMRAKLFFDFASQYVPACRAVHTRLYVNDELWGLYTAVEQIDKTFCQDRFGSNEDGNLFKGAGSDDTTNDFDSDLTYLGSSPDEYYDHYQLKTNETENDYSQLINFIDILNNTSTASLPAQLEPVFDVSNGLTGLALNNLFVNLDAYNGSAHNYYLYDRDDTGQFSHIHWDTNEAFARFLMFMDHADDPLELDPFWMPIAMGPPPPQEEDRPLMENLWAVDEYNREYLRDLADMLRNGFDYTTMGDRIDELADIIRTDVYADSNKMYSNSQFETNLYSNIQDGMDTIYGLRYFVDQRADWLDNELDSYAEKSDIQLNEIMSINSGTVQDNAGDYDPWIEIYNLGPGNVSLSGLYLTDTTGNPTKWALPTSSLDDGEYQVIWMDNETGEGSSHASFTLNPLGGTLYLYQSGSTLIDSITYPGLTADNAYARIPDGDGEWETTDQPTPGASNLPSLQPVELYINEIMADNDSILEDPEQPGIYEDWFEIYNPNDTAVVLSGMYLTDDLTEPTKYPIPIGVSVPASGYLIFWADDDNIQGGTHTNFKLAAAGEEIGLFDTDNHSNREIDFVVFGVQTTDVAYGRCPDGSETFEFHDYASPGSANCQAPTPTPTPPPGTPTYTPTPVDVPELYINEFMASNSSTIADNYSEYEDWVEIYNGSGEIVDLSGMYLTDDPALPTQWQIPSGAMLTPGAYILFWCDGDTEQGSDHANFKLSADGEFIGIYGTDAQFNALIDSYEFDEQLTDVSMGRCPDGTAIWQTFDPASPESTNGTECIAPTPTPTPAETPTPECIRDGDVNGDGSVTAGDAQVCFTIALGAYLPSVTEECAADCNGDGEITAGDAQRVFSTALGQDSCVD